MDAASTTKVAIAALYVDLIEAGMLSWETELPYYDSYYEAGNGEITNLEKQSTYSVEALIDNMLTYSDNTAANILANYHIDSFSSSFNSYRWAIAELSGTADLPAAIYEGNNATARMLSDILVRVATNDAYTPL